MYHHRNNNSASTRLYLPHLQDYRNDHRQVKQAMVDHKTSILRVLRHRRVSSSREFHKALERHLGARCLLGLEWVHRDFLHSSKVKVHHRVMLGGERTFKVVKSSRAKRFEDEN